MRLEPGMLIKTNYSGPYKIRKVIHDCDCPLDQHACPTRPPHMHIVCSRPDGTGWFYLNGYDEETLRSMTKSYAGNKTELDYDWIEVLGVAAPIQQTFF